MGQDYNLNILGPHENIVYSGAMAEKLQPCSFYSSIKPQLAHSFANDAITLGVKSPESKAYFSFK